MPTVPKGLYPKKTFQGRERVSLVPRWISNYSTVFAILYFGYGYLSGKGVDPFANRTQEYLHATETALYTPLPDYPLATPHDFSSSTGNLPSSGDQAGVVSPSNNNVAPAYSLTPAFTPTVTPTPFPTIAPYSAYIPVGKLVAVGYSYYWPPWGPPNCSDANWHEKENYCDDTTASGLPWSQYVERAVAVPYEWRDVIPLQSIIRIHSPEIMRGDYLVIDYCGDCIKKEGHIYFDFLSSRQILAWTVPMMAEVITQ